MKKTLLLSVILLGCAKPAPTEKAEEPAPVAVEIVRVQREDVEDALSVDGSLVMPEGSTSRLAPTVAGKLVEVRVKEGDPVVAGQLLARIDTRALVAQSQSALAGAASASAVAFQTELALRAAKSDQASAVEAARLALDVAIADGKASVESARADVARLLAPPRPPEIAQAQQAIDTATIARDKARLDADRDARLLREGLVAGAQADASAAALASADSAVKSAQAALALLRIGPRPDELHAARARLSSAQGLASKRIEQARAALRLAESGRLAVAAKGEEAVAARLAAGQKAADARAAAAGIATGEIRSPVSGFVVRRFLNPGDSADPAMPVLAVSASRPVSDFVGNVSPTEAERIAPGMRFVVGRLAGRVSSVGQADPATGLVPIRAHLAGVGAGFATGRVVLSVLRDVAVVPKGAVLSREGKDVVFVAKDGAAHLTSVSLGPPRGERIAVLKGLSVGADVIVLGGHELSDGAKIEAAKTP